MNVTLSQLPPRYAISPADDPFKKYWWAILMGIVFTALWLLTPLLGEKSIGSTAIGAGKPAMDENVEQNLSVAATDDGGALSMNGAGSAKKDEGRTGSSLYQAPLESSSAATKSAAPLGAASGSTLAGALKQVSESGGWNEKPQKGFSAPKLAGGSLSGINAASGGRSGSASGTNAFGSKNATVGFESAKGLAGGNGEDAVAGRDSRGVVALRAASAQAALATRSASGDDARSSLSKIFDGAKGGKAIGGNSALLPGGYAALDVAPVNLKLNDPKLNDMKITPPPTVDAGAESKDNDIAKQIAMQVLSGIIGNAIGGPFGSIVVNSVMQAIEQEKAQAREQKSRQEMEAAVRRAGF